MKRLTKPNLLIAVLWLVILPWFSGGQEPVAVLVSLFALLAATFLIWRLPQPAALRRGLFITAGVGFIGWSALSLLWSVNRYQTIRSLIILVLAAAVFAVAYQFNGQWHKIKLWLHGYLVIATAFSLIGFWFYLTAGYPRLTSTFYWANPFAAFLIPAVLISGWYFATTSDRRYLAALVPCGAAFVLTDSRGAGLIVALVVLYILVRMKLKPAVWSRLLLSAALAFGLAAAINFYRQHDRHLATLTPGARFAAAVQGENSTSQQDRIYYLRSALLIWKDHPLIGTGSGTYASVHPHYQLRVISAASHAHNYYAQTMAELGLVGAILLALTLWGLWLGLRRAIKADPAILPLAVALLAVLAHFAIDIDSSYPAVFLLIAALAGLTYRPPEHSKSIKYTPVVLAALLAVGLPAVSLYRSQLSQTAGDQAQADGDYQLAASNFNTAHAGVAYNPDTLTAEGINELTLARQGQNGTLNLALAKDRATNVIKLDHYDAQHHFLLARVLNQLQQREAAEKEYQQAIQIDPYNNPDYYTDLAQLELNLGHTAAALDYANRGIGLYPDSVIANRSANPNIPKQVSNLLTIRGLIYLNLHQLDAAKNDANRALKLNSKNGLAAQVLQQAITNQ